MSSMSLYPTTIRLPVEKASPKLLIGEHSNAAPSPWARLPKQMPVVAVLLTVDSFNCSEEADSPEINYIVVLKYNNYLLLEIL
jgi:hypothetical protein